ncbi:MAG: hypothetical protein HYZ11_08290 [Candidatus Tectomicrobia bacterium]|uniref:Uncharacterized protein n=1 Tax=Tectimicrobiota bacterium TaxID=2528274 RepID=A0A932MPY4_UNCTE|nr:hypothetical protein [Candidatus Tectomicrobia bacterium]
MNGPGGIWGLVIFLLALGFLLFLVLREFWCWFYKYNRMVSSMERSEEILAAILKSQRRIEKALEGRAAPEPGAPPGPAVRVRSSA